MRKPVHRATMPACALILAAVAQPVFAQRATRRVFVSASDSAGAAVPGLRVADFTVTERGAPREITRVAIDAPMRLLLLVESTAAVGSSLTQFRNALTAFLDALDPELEVGFITTGGQLKVRSPVSADRQALRSQLQSFSSESGGNSMIESILEADRRFLKNAPDRWPVFVLVTTDTGSARGNPPIDRDNAFVSDYVARGGAAHAVIIQGPSPGIVTTVLANLTANTNGALETINISNALPDKLRAVARRISDDRIAMTGKYALEHASDAKAAPGADLEARVARDGVRVRISPRRPF